MLSWESISLRATSFPLAGTSDYAAFTNRRTTATWLFAPALLWLVGCGGGPAMAPVTGKITVSGQPATRGSVIFMPDNSKGTTGKGAVGDIRC